jgi:Protein of unknown function (DUF1579)
MKRTLLAFIFIHACGVWAGEPASSQPKPNPELKKQNFFVGNWTLTGETKSSPFGPGEQKFQSTERLEWMPGEFFLVAHSYSGDKWVELTVIGYDPNEKVFTHTSFNASGKTEVWKGTADDNAWVWTKKKTVGGKPVTERMTINKTSQRHIHSRLRWNRKEALGRQSLWDQA